jgi:acyl-CoA-binding protein/uncharacterized membrane protein YeaQ/YmgE (transglycosylase-associated protein family)
LKKEIINLERMLFSYYHQQTLLLPCKFFATRNNIIRTKRIPIISNINQFYHHHVSSSIQPTTTTSTSSLVVGSLKYNNKPNRKLVVVVVAKRIHTSTLQNNNTINKRAALIQDISSVWSNHNIIIPINTSSPTEQLIMPAVTPPQKLLSSLLTTATTTAAATAFVSQPPQQNDSGWFFNMSLGESMAVIGTFIATLFGWLMASPELFFTGVVVGGLILVILRIRLYLASTIPSIFRSLDDEFEEKLAFFERDDSLERISSVDDDDLKLRVFVLKLQALFGDAQEDEKPWFWQRDARTKWEAWYALRGIRPNDAKRMYIETANELIKKSEELVSLEQSQQQQQELVVVDSNKTK